MVWRAVRRLFDPTIAAVPIVVVAFALLRSAHLVADLPVWGLAVLVSGAYLISGSVASLWPQKTITGWQMHVCVATQIGVITVVIYAVGWGPTLAIGLLFGVANCLRTIGVRAARPAIVYCVVGIGAGQLAIATHLAPTLVAPPLVHAIAVLATLGVVFTAKLLEWVFGALEGAERRFKALVQHAADIIVATDATGLVTYASPAFEERLGYDHTQQASLLAPEIAHPDDHERIVEAMAGARGSVDRPATVEMRIRTAAGDWRWFDVSITDRLHDPDVGAVVANLHDITDRKVSEAALAEAEERFRTSFDEAPIGMLLVDLDARLLRANRAFSDIVGHSRGALEGVSVHDLTHPDDQEESALWSRRLLDGDVPSFHLEKRYLHADGHPVWTSLHARLVRDSENRPLYAIAQIEDITERRAMTEWMEHAAIHDPLTGLPNRVLFMDRLEVAMKRSVRRGSHVAVMFLDVDRFKLVNDSMGHEVGDQLLQAVAARIRGAVRPADTVARFGGDEFTILCDDITHPASAREVADRTLAALAEPFELADGEVFVTASVGVALSGPGEGSPSVLLRNADSAMYGAKERGRASVELYDQRDDVWNVRRLRTGNDLHRALERDEFELHYQPVADLHTSTMVAVEALVRWQHPTRGELLPGEFIDLAEDSGLIVPLGYWVLGEACRQGAEWRTLRDRAGLDGWRMNVAVNVSPRQLAERSFASRVIDIVGRSGIDPDTVLLEITEGTVMRDPEHAVRVLTALRDYGMHICIDDFGTGYSSLSYLKRLPVETLKIDRSFVHGLGSDPEDTAIVHAVIGLANSLGLMCVAEGVEHAGQVDSLRALGCHLAQGFLFGMPQPGRVLAPYPTDDLGSWRPAASAAS